MTQYDQTGVQRVRASVESSFGADMTSDIATNFFDLRVCEHFELMRKTIVADDTSIVQRAWQQNQVVVSALDRWEAPLKCYFQATGQTLNSATSPTKTAQSKVLEVILGGYDADQGSDVVGSPSPTTTGFSVTTGHGTRFNVGQLIAIMLGGGTSAYLRLITAISTDAISIWPALPSAPSTGDDVLNGQVLYLTDAPSGSLSLMSEAAVDRNNIYMGLGGQGTLALDFARGNLTTWTASMQGPKYKHDDEFTTPLGSGSTIAAATFTGSGPIHSMHGLVHFGPTGSTTLTSIRDAGFTINLAFTNVEVNEFNGVLGVGQWHRNTRAPITIDLTIPGAHETYQDAFLAGTTYGFLAQFGTGNASVRGVCAPTVHIVAPPEPVEINGMRGTKLSLRALENGLSSDKTTEIRRSPITIFT